jgi:ankyrin repeat protein
MPGTDDDGCPTTHNQPPSSLTLTQEANLPEHTQLSNGIQLLKDKLTLLRTKRQFMIESETEKSSRRDELHQSRIRSREMQLYAEVDKNAKLQLYHAKLLILLSNKEKDLVNKLTEIDSEKKVLELEDEEVRLELETVEKLIRLAKRQKGLEKNYRKFLQTKSQQGIKATATAMEKIRIELIESDSPSDDEGIKTHQITSTITPDDNQPKVNSSSNSYELSKPIQSPQPTQKVQLIPFSKNNPNDSFQLSDEDQKYFSSLKLVIDEKTGEVKAVGPANMLIEVNELELVHSVDSVGDNQFDAQSHPVSRLKLQARNDRVFSYLLHRTVDLNRKGPNGYTLLHEACDKIQALPLIVFKDLIERDGFDVLAKDKDNDTPLHIALGSFKPGGDAAILTYLLTQIKAHANVKGKFGYTLLHKACERINAIPLSVFKILIETKGFGINVLDGHGNAPLHHALFGFNSELGDVKVLTYLLNQKGLNINLRGQNGLTFLHMACFNPRLVPIEIYKLLIETKGAKFYFASDGRSPLHYLMDNLPSKPDAELATLVQYLIRKGVSVNKKTISQRLTALDYFIGSHTTHPLTHKMLLSNGAKVGLYC